ncbi:hypothetical protein ACHMW6_25670 [Pseudoduganella sp. UC29_106]|uniref:hypothetical protein n=1 Tax=Pseudoduganella sp. UC29_106 TaxID=3374553 RepID=UPI0037579E6A
MLPAILLIEELSAWLGIAIAGHVYDATASCMNSMLKIAAMAVRIREQRVVFMKNQNW